jgi:hypothetical protein
MESYVFCKYSDMLVKYRNDGTVVPKKPGKGYSVVTVPYIDRCGDWLQTGFPAITSPELQLRG